MYVMRDVVVDGAGLGRLPLVVTDEAGNPEKVIWIADPRVQLRHNLAGLNPDRRFVPVAAEFAEAVEKLLPAGGAS